MYGRYDHEEAIMKQRRTIRGFVATAISLAALMATVQSALAQTQPAPRIARDYEVWLARAMDPCVLTNDGPGPTVTVVSTSNVPAFGCLQQNTATDSNIGLNFARVRVSQRGRVGLFAGGLTVGDLVAVRLDLRVTRAVNKTKHPPGSNKSVTFTDLPVVCPSFAARPGGAVAAATDLATCLGANSGLAATGGTNIEILDAALINANTGKVIGVPGVVRK